MNTRHMKGRAILQVLLGSGALALAGCGGGGSSSMSDPGPVPAAAATMTTFGTISGFGSVIVNGVHYETNGTQFSHDGSAITQNDLRVGQFVRLRAEISDSGEARAMEVERDNQLEGPIDAIDTAAGTITVLGQTVAIDADTSFDDSLTPASIDGLSVGLRVEVDGLPGADGVLHATRIEAADDNGEVEVTGTVAGLDADAKTFQIGDLVVDYSQATLEDFPSSGLADGDSVEVKGETRDGQGHLLATRVELKRLMGNDEGEDGQEVEFEGLITRFVSASDFDVGDHTVTTTSTTEFDGGTAEDLALNVKVVVEGELDADGRLVAREVKLRHRSDTRLSGEIEAIDTTAGTLTVMGIKIEVNTQTRIEDRTSEHDVFLALSHLALGDQVEIRGFEDPANPGQIIATRLERKDRGGDDGNGSGENEFELRGLVDAVTPPTLSINGQSVETSADTRFEDHGVPVDAQAFFDTALGQSVEAEGTWNGTTLIADKLKIEDEESGDHESSDDNGGASGGDDGTDDNGGGDSGGGTDDSGGSDNSGGG